MTAGRNIAAFAITTYETLTSDRAKETYKTIWLLAQLCFWLSVLAMRFTIKLGQQFRKYYEAEWAADTNRLADWITTYPDRCLLPEAQTDTPDNATNNKAIDNANNKAVPEAVQSILDGSGTKTAKLRAIASHYHIKWRNTRGGKHMLNSDLRDRIGQVCPAFLTAF